MILSGQILTAEAAANGGTGMRPGTRLKTRRLELTALSDAELERRIAEEPDAHMRRALAEMLALCREHPEKRQFCTEWQMARRDGVPVGSLCFKGPPEGGEVEIGYGVDEACRGLGYATEAAKVAVNWAFYSLPELYYVTAEAESDNAASRAVLQKLGFVPAGRGTEGDRYELERPMMSWTGVYLALGLSVGVCFGVTLGSLAVSLPVGLCAGLAIGGMLDRSERGRREAVRAQRQGRGRAMDAQSGESILAADKDGQIDKKF